MKKERLIDFDKKQIKLLKDILECHIPNKTVWAYGSRVNWKAQEASDLDLAVFGCNSGEIGNLKEALDESSLLVSVDVMDWESIPEKFRENIKRKYVVVQRGLDGWREVKLGEVAKLSKIPWKVGDEKLPYIALEHFVEGGLRLNRIGSSDEVASNKWQFTHKDFLFGKLRPYFRKLYRPDFDGICSTDIWVVSPIEENDKDFLFYVFANKEFIELSYLGSSGTRMPRADWSFVKEMKLNIPPLPEQKAIAEVLSSLDDKIDLLHRQNKTLEDMAQALFRKWFVEDADEGWEEKPLSDYGDVICGKTPSKKIHNYFGGNIPFIKIPDMHGKTFIFDTTDTLTEEGRDFQKNKTLLPKSICVSCIATVGLVSMNVVGSQTNQQINSIIPHKDEYRYYIYLFMKSSKNLLKAMAKGGTVTMNLNTANFAKLVLPTANEEHIYKFHNVVKRIFEKIFSNQTQIRTLAKLRDILLPKLMKGILRIRS